MCVCFLGSVCVYAYVRSCARVCVCLSTYFTIKSVSPSVLRWLIWSLLFWLYASLLTCLCILLVSNLLSISAILIIFHFPLINWAQTTALVTSFLYRSRFFKYKTRPKGGGYFKQLPLFYHYRSRRSLYLPNNQNVGRVRLNYNDIYLLVYLIHKTVECSHLKYRDFYLTQKEY